jgi:hypothetical protein
MILLFLLYITPLFVVVATADEMDQHAARLTPYVTIKTNVPCQSMRNCLVARNGGTIDWCETGVTCTAGFCYLLPDYPCPRASRVCDAANKTCVHKPCSRSSECDDGLFCTGAEKCYQGLCMPDVRTPAPCGAYGICDEASHVCLQQWHNQSLRLVLDALVRQLKVDRVHLGKQDTGVSINGGNWSGPTHCSNGCCGDDCDNWWVWLIVSIFIILFFVLVFLMVAVGNRSWTPVPVNSASWQYT